MLLSQLGLNQNALDLLSFASCFGSRLIPISLLDETLDLDKIRMLRSSTLTEPQNSNTSLMEKSIKLQALTRNRLSLSSAISFLENLCLLKTRRGLDLKTVSFSIHGSIGTWRLETLTSVEREDWIILAAISLSQHLPAGGLEKGLQLRYLPFIQQCRHMIHKYINPANLKAPQGRLFEQYGTLAPQFSQIFLGNVKLLEAEDMLTAALEYQMILQDSLWPEDRASLILLQDFADISSKLGKLDRAVEAYEKIVEACPNRLDDEDDLAISVAARLRNISERKIRYVEGEERVIIASQSEKRRQSVSRDAPPGNMQSHEVSDKEWTLSEVLRQSQEEFGATDQFTVQAVRDLAWYYTETGAYSTAIPLWVRARQDVDVFPDESKMFAGRRILVADDVVRDLHAEISCRLKQEPIEQLGSSFNRQLAYYACSSETDWVRILISLGATSSVGNLLIPLSIAVYWGRVNTVACILESGIDVNMTDHEGATCLIMAYRDSRVSIEAVELLLKHGADVNAKDRRLLTPLHTRIRSLNDPCLLRNTDEFEFLLRNGAEVNTKAVDGETPLHDAVRKMRPFMVELLINHGAGVNVVNKDGSIPFDIAISRPWEGSPYYHEVIKVLRKYGAESGPK